DGAIDLASFIGPARCIVECKFIGSETTSSATAKWREVKDHLVNNLPKLADGDDSGRANYQPWLSTDLPIAFYRFCVSSIEGVHQRDKLRERIIKDFRDISEL